MTHCVVDGNIRAQHIHTLQQVIIETGQLGVFETSTPIVGHQLIVGSDGKKPVGIDLMRMHREKGIQRMYSLTEAATLQEGEDLI